MENDRGQPYDWWDDRYTQAISETQSNKINTDIISSPRKIYNYLSKRIAGNEELLKTVSCAVYSLFTLNPSIPSHHLIIGNSGCGKSYVFKVLSEIIPVIHHDCANSSAAAYRGTNRLTSAIEQLVEITHSTCPKGIIVYDEFDKLLEKQGDLGVESEVLRMLDNADVYIGSDTGNSTKNSKVISCENISFFFCGTFAALGKDKRKHEIGFSSTDATISDSPAITKDDILNSTGTFVSNEFLGRLTSITSVENMSPEKIKYILHSENYSPLTHLSEKYGIKLNLTKAATEKLCDLGEAYGLRGITNEITNIINQQIFIDETVKEINI